MADKIKFSEKIAYALGDAAAGGIVWKVMSIAFPLFFTNIFGLSFADAAMLMLIARLFDVVTDPIMGSLADRTQSRWGTYRPWLIFGAIPLGLIFALLLYTPDLGPVGKRIWAYTLYLLMMAVYTAVNVPYGSLLGVMTDDDNQKNEFSSYRMVGAYAMGFITLLSFPYLQKMVGGSDAHQYAVLGAILGGLAAILTLICGFFTKERLKPVRAEKYSFKQFADLFKNKPWLILTAAGICTNFFNGFRYAVVGYMIDYCLDGNVTVGSLIINYTVLMAFGEVTCMIFGGLSPKFTTIIGSKRGAFIGASIICIVTSVLFFFIPMDPSYIWVMVGMVILTSMGIGLYSPLLWSMYSDVADYATETFGTSSTGLIFSSGTMAQKLGTAISGSLIALMLGLAGANMITDAMGNTIIDPASVTDSVRTMVWSLFSLIPAAIAVIMALLAYVFPIRKQMNPMQTRKVIIIAIVLAVLAAACFLLPKL
ncbi:MAG: MFS transporter [Bacteroidales bacterium]|nr:MFS transporter [Bacteroidales bacterium]